MENKYKGFIFMILSATGFSLVGLIIKFLNYLPSQELVFFRSSITLFLVYIMMIKHKLYNPFKTRYLKLHLIRGIAGALGLSLYFLSFKYLTLAEAVSIQYTNPLFTALLSPFIAREKVKKTIYISITIALIGVLLIAKPNPSHFNIGAIFGLTAALIAGTAYNMVRILNKLKENVFLIIFYFQFMATIISLPIFYKFQFPHKEHIILVILLGIFTHFAQYFLTLGLKYLKAANATSISYLNIGLSTIYSYVILHESLDIYSFLGIGAIIMSLFITYKV